MRMKFITGVAFLLLISASCVSQKYEHPFRNPDLSINERVDDLLGRLTPEEKVGQMMNQTPAIDRLGIPPYDWWNEALHGVARAGKATQGRAGSRDHRLQTAAGQGDGRGNRRSREPLDRHPGQQDAGRRARQAAEDGVAVAHARGRAGRGDQGGERCGAPFARGAE